MGIDFIFNGHHVSGQPLSDPHLDNYPHLGVLMLECLRHMWVMLSCYKRGSNCAGTLKRMTGRCCYRIMIQERFGGVVGRGEGICVKLFLIDGGSPRQCFLSRINYFVLLWDNIHLSLILKCPIAWSFCFHTIIIVKAPNFT